MTEAAQVFNSTNRDLAITKRSASKRKCGSKSKKCTLAVDYMSDKELEKKNGSIETYKLGGFMTFEEFKKLPDDLKPEYINNLIDKYEVGPGYISTELFGKCYTYLKDLAEHKGFSLHKRPHNSSIARKNNAEFKKVIDEWRTNNGVPYSKSVMSDISTESEPDVMLHHDFNFQTTYVRIGLDEEEFKNLAAICAGKRVRVNLEVCLL